MKMKKTLTETPLKHMIMDLLCLDNGQIWAYRDHEHYIELKFKGNKYNVQKDIYNWLSLPQRKFNFENLSD